MSKGVLSQSRRSCRSSSKRRAALKSFPSSRIGAGISLDREARQRRTLGTPLLWRPPMRRACFCFSLVLILVSALQAKKRDKDPTAGFPRVLLNARFVYVTSFTGGEFNISTYPEDRAAIDTVQEAIQKWGRYTLVYKPEDAEVIFNVRAGRELEARAGVRVASTPPPTGTGV